MIENPMYTADPPEPEHYITSLEDLCNYFSADEPRLLNKRIYKATDCGASISLHLEDKAYEALFHPAVFKVNPHRGAWIHNGDELWEKLSMDTSIVGFTIQTIVEGSDATVDSEEFVLPVAESKVDEWIKSMERKASTEWENANDPICTCGHRSGQHRWDDDPRFEKGFAVKGFECEAHFDLPGFHYRCTCQEFKEDEWYGAEGDVWEEEEVEA